MTRDPTAAPTRDDRTAAALDAMLERLAEVETEINALREPFKYRAELRPYLDEEMISGAFGNIITNIATIRNHARRLHDSRSAIESYAAHRAAAE